jgi:hypothetical protein
MRVKPRRGKIVQGKCECRELETERDHRECRRSAGNLGGGDRQWELESWRKRERAIRREGGRGSTRREDPSTPPHNQRISSLLNYENYARDVALCSGLLCRDLVDSCSNANQTTKSKIASRHADNTLTFENVLQASQVSIQTPDSK